jgi:hypothetical protein
VNGMGYKDDLIKARDITASNYRQGKMSPYDDPFNDTYYDQEGWNKELTEAASKDDKIKYEEYLKRQREEREAYYRGMRTEQRVDALEREYENMDINEKIEARKKAEYERSLNRQETIKKARQRYKQLSSFQRVVTDVFGKNPDKINIDHMSVESIDNLYGGRNK